MPLAGVPKIGVVNVGEVVMATLPVPLTKYSPRVPELSYNTLPLVPEPIEVVPTVNPDPTPLTLVPTKGNLTGQNDYDPPLEPRSTCDYGDLHLTATFDLIQILLTLMERK